MKNVKYTVTDSKKLVFYGVVNADGTSISVTKDDGTTTSITPAQVFSDFFGNTVDVSITSRTTGPNDGDTVEVYDVINGET